MAILTQDGALAGMQPPRMFAKAVTPTLVAGRPASLWTLAGAPGAGTLDTTLNGAVLSSSSAMVVGQIPHVNPPSGNSYLARFQAMATIPGTLLLCDRLWNNQVSATLTSSQIIASPTWPARDSAASTNGDGVHVGIEVSVATGAAAPFTTLGYTNQAGTLTRTANILDTVVNSSAIGTFYRFGLAAGDTGIRQVTSFINATSWLSGTLNLVAYRLLAALELTAANTANAIDLLTSGFPRIPDGAVPFLIFIPSTTTPTNISGSYVESQG